MKTLNAIEIQNVSGAGNHPILRAGVFALPVIGAVEGAMVGYKMSQEAGSALPVEGMIIGAGIGFTAGLILAIGLDAERPVQTQPQRPYTY